jgi:DNA-binding GntR family transcriptional regulator
MESSTTYSIVEALTKAIVEHRLHPGTKLAEQKLADHFGVSRTLVRQALFQLSQNRLIRLEPARGAFVAAPSVTEAKQVFAVRRMLEAEMTRAFVRDSTPARIKSLKEHVAREQAAFDRLISRCALITLMYQSSAAAAHSHEEHALIVKALAARDVDKAVQLMHDHLLHVEENLTFDRKVPSNDISMALS